MEFLAYRVAKNGGNFPLRSLRPVTFHEVIIDKSVRIQPLKTAVIAQGEFLEWNPALGQKAEYLPWAIA
jgi:hypothetical protein